MDAKVSEKAFSRGVADSDGSVRQTYIYFLTFNTTEQSFCNSEKLILIISSLQTEYLVST